MYDKYVRLLEALNLLEEERRSRVDVVKSFLKTMKSSKFFGMYYLLIVMLTLPSTLSKSFQTRAITFSRIIPNVLKAKAKLQ